MNEWVVCYVGDKGIAISGAELLLLFSPGLRNGSRPLLFAVL